MVDFQHIATILLAYLTGSVPSSVWIGKIFYGIDVREYGSGNAGATNTFRVLGKKAGIPVLILDALKGYVAVYYVTFFPELEPGTSPYVNLQLALGLAALFGHIFPIYVGFRGGKGIATLLGMMLAVYYQAALLSVGVFLIVLFISRFVSLSSIIAGISFPIFVILVFHSHIPSLVIFSIFISILVIITHQKNIERLLRKEESKANISLKKAIKSDKGQQ